MEHKQRSYDNNSIDIEDFIKGENDPKTRAFLMVMNSMNMSLIANTEIVKDIDTQLKSHLVEFNSRLKLEESYINKGKGAWKAASWCLAIAQIIIVGFVTNTFSEVKSLHNIDELITHRITILETRVNK